MNFLAIFALAIFFFAEIIGINITNETRETLFKASVGMSAVLLAANIALPFVAMVFHDVNTMTGLFIHFMSPLVMYTIHWHSDEIVSAWPNVFDFSYMDSITYYGGESFLAHIIHSFRARRIFPIETMLAFCVLLIQG